MMRNFVLGHVFEFFLFFCVFLVESGLTNFQQNWLRDMLREIMLYCFEKKNPEPILMGRET